MQKYCNICNKKFKSYLNLGKHPCADSFLNNKYIAEKIKKRIGIDVAAQENLDEIVPETPVINDKSAAEPKKENPKKDAELKTKLKKEK